MKKFLAIAASAVLAFGALSFTACGNGGEQQSAADLTYTEVDLSTPEKKSAFIEEVTTKMNFDTMFGDTTAENYSLGLAADMNYNIDMSATVKDVPVSEAVSKDLSASAKLDFGGSTKVKVSADGSLLGESQTAVKLNATLPDEFYSMVEMPKQAEEMVKALINNFDYSLTEYIGNGYLYAQFPQSFMDLLPAEVAGMLPESGKIKIPLDMGEVVPPVVKSYSAAPSVDSQTALIVGQVMEMLVSFGVNVATSTQNGFAIRLTADKNAVMSVLGAVTGEPQAVAMIEQLATFNTCALTAYLAVDANGMFKEVGINIDLDASVNIAANLFGEGSPAISGALKVSVGMSVKTFDGDITLPSDLDTYVDMSSLMQ